MIEAIFQPSSLPLIFFCWEPVAASLPAVELMLRLLTRSGSCTGDMVSPRGSGDT